MAEEAIKPEYRKTDIGIIPEDWKMIPLSQVGEIIDGDRGTHYPNSNDFSEDGYCLFLSAKNVTKTGFEFDECQFISKDKDECLGKGKLKRGDIVLTTRGTVGNIAFFDNTVKFENIRINSGMVIIRIDATKKATREYYYKLCQSKLLSNQIDRLAFGSAQPQLTVKGISTFHFPLPPTKEEQTAIATALSDTDALIESLNKLIKKKKNIKQGAMQELLTGKKRLPGFSNLNGKPNNYKQTEVGIIPEDWEVNKVKDFTDATSGGTPSTFRPEYWNGNIRWMNSGELNLKKVYDVEGRISELGLRNSSTKLIPEKCILIGLAGQGKTRGTVAINYVELCTNQSIGAIYPNDSFVSEYLYYNLDSRYNEFRNLSTGASGRGGLNLTLIRNLLVPLPQDQNEQSAIAQVLSDMDAEIEELEQKRDKYLQLKAGMMQQLLTGKIRLKW